MKFIGIILLILACIAYLGWGLKIKTKEVEKYKDPVFAAPADLKEYPPQGSIDLGEGLYYKTLEQGTDPIQIYDKIEIEYTGWNFRTGKMFDSSNLRANPFALMVGSSSIIQGWRKVLPQLRFGQKIRIWIPKALAYPTTQNPKIQGMLVFDMKIVSHTPAAFEEDLAEYPYIPPKHLKASATGIKSLLIEKGTGKRANADSIVTIYDTKWSKKGELLSSSKQHQRKKSLDLAKTVPGLKEAILMMKEGEKRRFWIPKKQLYGEKAPFSYPVSDWIWDVELLEVQPSKS